MSYSCRISGSLNTVINTPTDASITLELEDKTEILVMRPTRALRSGPKQHNHCKVSRGRARVQNTIVNLSNTVCNNNQPNQSP